MGFRIFCNNASLVVLSEQIGVPADAGSKCSNYAKISKNLLSHRFAVRVSQSSVPRKARTYWIGVAETQDR